MSAFNDTRCEKCGKRFGWQGKLADRPKCPGCGHRPSQASLEATDREMEEAEARIFGRLEEEEAT